MFRTKLSKPDLSEMPKPTPDSKAEEPEPTATPVAEKMAIGTSPSPIDPPEDPDIPATPDVPQISAPLPQAPKNAKTKLPYGADLGSDDESRAIAAEVAAILSPEKKPNTTDSPGATGAPRPLIVRLPSERWLSEASAKLEELPLEQRAQAFHEIVAKYRAMRAAERTRMHNRN